MNYLPKITTPNRLITLLGDFPSLTGTPELLEDRAVLQDDTVKVTAIFEPHKTGLTKRTDTVQNITDRPITIHTALSRFMLNGGEYEVYTQYSQWCRESQGLWQALNTGISGTTSDVRTNSSAAPFVALFNRQTGRGLAFHILSNGTWRYDVRKYFRTGGINNVLVELGMDNSNLALTLQPGESFTLPQILFYEFKNKVDMEAYRLHRYCKDFHTPRAFPVMYNSWMSDFDRISYEKLSAQLEIAQEMGVEYFVVDAGWFGPPNAWFGSVGDWKERKDVNMCGRMQEFADKVRACGLKFGLWFEMERASQFSQAYQNNPQYYIFSNKQAFIDFSNPAACDYLFEIIATQIRKYGIEFIKTDFNASLFWDWHQDSFTAYMNGYNRFMARLRETFPTLYLQNCAAGGGRLSLSSMQNFDSFWITDNHSLYTQLEVFKDTLLRMPSRALETWVTIQSLENFRPVYNGDSTEKILVSGDACWGGVEVIPESFLYTCIVGGPLGITCDLTKLSVATREKLKAHIAQLKAQRQFWQDSECHILCDTPTMLVLQFCDEAYKELKVYVYAKNPQQTQVTVYPVTDGGVYTRNNGTQYTAEELEEDGISIPVKDICGASFTLTKN